MTHVIHMDFRGVTAKNLSSEMREALAEWRNGVLEPTPKTKYGLWLFGERQAGTSYVARVASGRMCYQHGYLDAEGVTAIQLLKELRAVWSTGSLMRTNADDVGLYWESVAAEDALEQHFNTDLLWIDDLHDETIDWNLWRKHIQPLVEARVKSKKATIISTTMDPDDDALPKGLVRNLFVTIGVGGFRPEVDQYDYARADAAR